MEYTVSKVEKGLYYLINVDGEFSIKSLRVIRDIVEECLGIGHNYIVFNLEKTSYIDSSGIGLLMNIYKKLIANGGKLFLLSISNDIENTLKSTRILQIVPQVKSIEEAERDIG